MIFQLLMLGIGLLITVTVIAMGSYVGTLRALDVFYGDGDSMFLSEEADEHRER